MKDRDRPNNKDLVFVQEENQIDEWTRIEI